jgi:hypothetical protein
MRKFTVILFLGFISFQAYGVDWGDWFAHINLSAGPNIRLDGDISDDSVYRITLAKTDGTTVGFDYIPSEIEIRPVNFGLGIRFPLYYNRLFAIGILANMGIGKSLWANVYGAYFEYYCTNKFSLLGSIGFSSAHFSTDLGSVSGETVSLSGNSAGGLGFVAAAKYHFLKYLFLEAGYAFVYKQGITDYDLKVGGEKIPLSGSPDQLDIGASHNIFIKIGVGI